MYTYICSLQKLEGRMCLPEHMTSNQKLHRYHNPLWPHKRVWFSELCIPAQKKRRMESSLKIVGVGVWCKTERFTETNILPDGVYEGHTDGTKRREAEWHPSGTEMMRNERFQANLKGPRCDIHTLFSPWLFKIQEFLVTCNHEETSSALRLPSFRRSLFFFVFMPDY